MAGSQECRWSSWLTGSVVLLDWGQVDQEQGREYFICANGKHDVRRLLGGCQALEMLQTGCVKLVSRFRCRA